MEISESPAFHRAEEETLALDSNATSETSIQEESPFMELDSDSPADLMITDSCSKLNPKGLNRFDSSEEVIVFVNAGGESAVTVDSGNTSVEPDKFFDGGDVIRTDEPIIDGGDYSLIYKSARLGNFSYTFQNLSPGDDYLVDLHFVEIVNTNGPKGMRVFDVLVQEDEVVTNFDIYSIVGANKPLQLTDTRVSVKEDGVLVIRFRGVHGSAAVSGICIKKASKASNQLEYIVCKNCAAKTEVSLSQKKCMRTKATLKFERKIEELSMQCQRKADECYEAWMSLNSANEQLETLRLDLDNKLFLTYSQEQALEKQGERLKGITTRYQRDKRIWMSGVRILEEEIKVMRQEHDLLSREAHECADSIPELNKMVIAVQTLVSHCEDLKVKFAEEQAKRKKLYNQVQEAKGNIRVFCRCRPLSDEEKATGETTVVDLTAGKEGDLGILTGGSMKKLFKFDRVYAPKDNQVDVFADAAPMVVSVLDGYNVCIFAYGQTGTGKTYTMEGTPEDRGVNYKTLEELFKVIEERHETYAYEISVSVLEVYNEQIRDLLAVSPTSKKLDIKQASEGFHYIPGIVEARVENIKQVWDVLQEGSNARAVGSNNVNDHSSRSHCILSIMVKAENLVNGECTKSKLRLIDLAGSERLGKTDAQGERLKEAQNINRSLSALGDVISALATKNTHIPYRNSKLTHLLQDSLGGDSKTLMFVQISPSEKDLGETLSSLNFATRVRGIELAPVKKQIDNGELQKMKIMLEKVRQESRCKDESMRKLEENLQNLEGKVRAKDHTCRIQQDKLRELEVQLESKAASNNQTEKQVSQLMEKLQARDELCSALQNKVNEQESILKEIERSKEKVNYLENKLTEQAQEATVQASILQNKVTELERKLREPQENFEKALLHQKIKELEHRLMEQEQRTHKMAESTDASRSTPVARIELQREEMNVLRNSNPMKRLLGQASMAQKGRDWIDGTRKREARTSGDENKFRRSDSSTPYQRTMKTSISKPVVQRPSSSLLPQNKRELGQAPRGSSGRESKKRIWSR